MNVRKAHKIWIEQCEATPTVPDDQGIIDRNYAWHFVNECELAKPFSMDAVPH